MRLQWKGEKVRLSAAILLLLAKLNMYTMFTYLTLLNMAILSLECIKIHQLVLFNQISSTRTFKCTVSIKCTVSSFFKRFLLSVPYKPKFFG